jgi:alpha-mannosidase
MKKVHLICNAHLDPVWLWEWNEGAGEALSTFRIAADFCDQYGGFVFNHNEVILYAWIEEYDPKLFARIQRLVKEGKWHIMGGWYLQPDCNMPSGESFVRHALSGRKYFFEKFGMRPTSAINFDSFGHSRGLVQILKKSGYDSYIVCRPHRDGSEMKQSNFVWVGYDGSEILVHRSDENYNSVRGQAAAELKEWLETSEIGETAIYLWGIGNHGGGPSKIDLDNLERLRTDVKHQFNLVHSHPEAFYSELKSQYHQLPRFAKSLNPVAQGCYTSQIRVKKLHRQLENEFFMAEKMASSAALQGYLKYPRQELADAERDLMTAQFHDALPGSAIQRVEEATLRLLGHGLEITSRVQARAFFALSAGQKKVSQGETPILVYNPHPFVVSGVFECEFVLPSQNWADEFSYPEMYQGDKKIPCQPEQEYSNFRMDWRKHAVFYAELQPGQMNRFDCKFKVMPSKPEPALKTENDKITVKTDQLHVEINSKTGLIDRYSVDGFDYLSTGSFRPIVVDDTYNSWGSYRNYGNIVGDFALMSKHEGSSFSGLPGTNIESVRVIEDGSVRVVVEAVLSYANSFICQQYKIPKYGSEVQVDVRVFWNEKDKMLKLAIPTLFTDGKYVGQTAYGVDELEMNGDEVASQKWVGVLSETDQKALTCINDGIYGSDYCNKEVRLTLLRSPSYATTDFLGRVAAPKDRFTARMEQGERTFSFYINGGCLSERLEAIDRNALVHNEVPYALSYCPSGEGQLALPLITLSDSAVQLTAFKKAVSGGDFIIRLFEPTGVARSTTLQIPSLGIEQKVELGGFEVKTLRLSKELRTLRDEDLME